MCLGSWPVKYHEQEFKQRLQQLQNNKLLIINMNEWSKKKKFINLWLTEQVIYSYVHITEWCVVCSV